MKTQTMPILTAAELREERRRTAGLWRFLLLVVLTWAAIGMVMWVVMAGLAGAL